MRLLITTDTVGGVWTYTKELSEGLLERGHDVLLISMGLRPSPDQHNWAVRTKACWPHTFRYLPTDHPLEWMQRNQMCYRAAESMLLFEISKWRPDILHLNQFCYGALPTDTPKIVIAHSDVISWSYACRGEAPCKSAWFSHYIEVVSCGLSQAHAVVAPTRWMMDALCSHYDVRVQRVVIANGRSITPRRRSQSRKLQAATIGRLWDEGKNIRLLEEVDSPMPLLVGGDLSLDGEPPFTYTRLQLLGRLSEEAALQLFTESSIYIATSRYEPFGLAPVEAALSGCAIVSNDIASLLEVWGDSAIYFSSPGELTLVLHALYGDRALLLRAANKARRRARSLFSRDAMIAKYLALYERLGAPIISPVKAELPAQYV